MFVLSIVFVCMKSNCGYFFKFEDLKQHCLHTDVYPKTLTASFSFVVHLLVIIIESVVVWDHNVVVSPGYMSLILLCLGNSWYAR